MIAMPVSAAYILVGQVDAESPLQWRLRWDWDWPMWLTVAAILLACLWVLSIYFRETSTAGTGMRALLSLLRLTALALALLMFAQPAIEWFRLGHPRLVLLLDRSASMDTLDRYPETTGDVARLDVVKQLLTDGVQSLIDRWLEDYQLDVVIVDERIERLATATSIAEQIELLKVSKEYGGGTRLGDALDYSLRELPGTPPVAVVVLTDGISTRGRPLEQAAQQARRLRVPLYTVAIGSDRRRPDIAVENLLVEEIVFPGDRLQVEATVRATGYAGQSAEAVLRDESGADLARTTIKLPTDDATTTVRLAIRPDRPGKLSLDLFIEPLADESDTENNRVQQTVEVRDEKIQVLMVQAQPSYEFRALKSMLERDPAVELKVVLQEADADYPTVDDTALATLPSSERELFAHDVLLLGDVDLGLLPRSVWPLVERFVTVHGGGMVGIAGPRFMPLAYRGMRSMELLLPMELESLNPLRSQLNGRETFAVFPTALGWRTPSLQLGETVAESERIWQALPPVSWMLRLEEVKPGAQVLAEHPGLTNRQGRPLPVILRQYVGAGEVLFHATDETWRWRWRTDDRYFARYWGQVVRRLGRGRLAAGRTGVRLTTDRSRYEPGEQVQLQARFRNPTEAPADDGQVVVQLQPSIGPSREVTLRRQLGRRGLFAATVENLAPSEYDAMLVRPDLGGSTTVQRFKIQRPPSELAKVAVNRQGLRKAAEISGGKSYTLENAARISAELPPPRQQAVQGQPPRQLWNSHAVMTLFVLVLSSEWLLRRRCGML